MNQKDFGLRLKELRQSHNLTQSQLAERLQMSRQAYSNYEQGRTSPSTETVANLSIILDTNLFTYFMNQKSNHLTNQKHIFTNKLDSEEFFTFLQLYSQMSVLTRSRLLNLMNIMTKRGD